MTQLRNIRPETKEMIFWAFISLSAWSVMSASAFLLDGLAKAVVGIGSLGVLVVAIVLFLANAFPLTGDMT